MRIYKITNTVNNKVYIGQTKKNISEAAKRGWIKRKANKAIKDV